MNSQQFHRQVRWPLSHHSWWACGSDWLHSTHLSFPRNHPEGLPRTRSLHCFRYACTSGFPWISLALFPQFLSEHRGLVECYYCVNYYHCICHTEKWGALLFPPSLPGHSRMLYKYYHFLNMPHYVKGGEAQLWVLNRERNQPHPRGRMCGGVLTAAAPGGCFDV